MTRFSELSNATKMFIIGTLLILISLFTWYRFVYVNPSETFWATVNGNLQTQGVTRHLVQKNDSGSLDQYLQLQLGETNLVSGKTTIERKQDGKTTSKIVTEDIGTPKANYSKYTEFMVTGPKGKNVDLSSVTNKWSVADLANSVQTQSVFNELTYGVLPFGRLNHNQRSELINLMQDKKVYSIDYAAATKETVNGRDAYRYKVSIAPEAYITMLQKFDQMMNLGSLQGVDPSGYANQSPFEVEIVIDIHARQILQIKYINDETREESYEGYGFQPTIAVPENAEPRESLEQRISELLQN